MMTWPLIQRNKVEDSKIDVPVKACAESDNEVLAELAKKVRLLHTLYSIRLDNALYDVSVTRSVGKLRVCLPDTKTSERSTLH